MNATDSFARLGIARSTSPMEARLIESLPEGEGWQFEPKWDGFRCLAFRDGDHVALVSKSGKPLERYFPELVATLRELPEDRFVVDGEIILPKDGTLSFAALQSRLHPAASRIAKLSEEIPTQLMLFDALQIGSAVLIDETLDLRRAGLENFAETMPPALLVSPFTYRIEIAQEWLEQTGGALDGVIAKRRGEPYRPGERAMFKHKVRRTADCVVGGFRYDRTGDKVASLLLGLYDEGLLHYVGFTSSFSERQRVELVGELAGLEGQSAFAGKSPGGASRWSKSGTSSEWVPLKPTKVVEVAYDQVTGSRFRHGTTFCRWRPDKKPEQCTFDQLAVELRPEQLEQIVKAKPG